MDTFWTETLVAATSGALGAAMTAVVVVPRIRESSSVESADETGPAGEVAPAAAPVPPVEPDPGVLRLQRCEQAIRRASRAADTMSSTSARRALWMVVRRMEAEIPNVRALVELGRSLSEGSGASARVYQQLDEATARFGVIADHVVDAVVQHVEDPDLDRLHTEVTVLRGQFPLLRSLSAVVGPARLRSAVPA